MEKRTIALFSMLMTCIAILMCSVYNVSTQSGLLTAAAQQSSYRLRIARPRGTIYDCRKNPLTGTEKKSIAAVSPTIEAANALTEGLSEDERESMYTMLSKGVPFSVRLDKNSSLINKAVNGIDVFTISERYEQDQPAPHVVGYLDGSGKGVSGIEQAYEEWLSGTGADISVSYTVDAKSRVLTGEKKVISDTSYLQTKGVVLTLDERIQKIAQEAAKKYLKKGAVVVAEVPSCDLRAVVSMPDFSPSDVESGLSGEDSPLVNRAFSSYNVGSVFKLIVAAGALDYGIPPDLTYDCDGSIDVDGMEFHCFGGEAHGTVDMKNAIAYSCNGYFIQLGQKVPVPNLLSMAKKLGFGAKNVFAESLASAAGVLPSEKELANSRALANFSFGQGSLMATPVQMAGVVNAIASGGKYTAPRLVEGLVSENMEWAQQNRQQDAAQVISAATAAKLQEYMKASVIYGTSAKGKPDKGDAGAKTATAETGIQADGHAVVQAWYAGFYPAEQPKYVIIVLAEDGSGGGASCGPVFKQIANEIADQIPGVLPS